MKHQNVSQSLADTLKEPKLEYRPIPFWSWNEKLESKELQRQIKLMKQSGVGGYFMHARGGLQTEYLEEPWFESIQVGIETGKSVGLHPWVYDEEGWPSGFAGGKVTALGDWVYARGLCFRRLQTPEQAITGEALLGVFALTEKDGQCVPVKEAKPEEDYADYVEISHNCSPHYIDVLNEKVIAAFLESTHDQYAERFELGQNGLYGFFTDEPRLAQGPIPWSYLMPQAFLERYGYDLMRRLPALFLPCEGYRKVRHDFWALVNELFVNAYMKQIGEWCEAHNCKLTGHMMMEESLYSQMTGTAGGMPFYEFMHTPGVDSLRRSVSDPRIPKQVGSVAEQLGKEQVLTESYAMSGWDVSFDEMRWIAGWQYVNGVNLMCQHLQGYSLRGLRKRDYPPSLYYQQTWYDEYYRFNDYLARLGQMLGSGKKYIDVLLVHPMHSGWVSYDGTNNEEIAELDRTFAAATELLGGAHIDYHLGDETILRRYGKVLPDGRIQVGNYQYGAVVIADSLTLDRTTLELVKAADQAGSPIVRLGQWPYLCEGEASAELLALKDKAVLAETPEALWKALGGVLEKPVHILKEGHEVLPVRCCQVALKDGGTALYMVNMSREAIEDVTLVLPGKVKTTRLELDTLESEVLSAAYTEGTTKSKLSFLPMQSIVVIYEEGEVQSLTNREAEQVFTLAGTDWDIRAMDDNLITLDFCSYRIDEGEWQSPKAVIHLMQELLDLRRPCDVELRFSFTVACQPESFGQLSLVMEQPHQFEVTVNGEKVSFNGEDWYKDISFIKTDILSYVKQGENTIELKARFLQSQHVYDVLYGENVYETELNKLTYDMELESIYLLGDFGVNSLSAYRAGERNSITTEGPFVLEVPPKKLKGGVFTTQGLTFFAGSLTLEKTVNLSQVNGRVILDLGTPRAALVKVSINETDVKTFLWAPYRCDITELVKPGDNKVTVTLFASNRNMLGPHHHTKEESYSVGPISFTGKFSWAERESEAVVITPEMRRKNYWQEGYSFVTFGL